jgi:hypothetical protein
MLSVPLVGDCRGIPGKLADMAWTDFDDATALERDVLGRALPLAATTSSRSAALVDLAANRADISIEITETIGPNPAGCVDLLGIRPLLVGAAWKVLDLLLELALEGDGLQPDAKTRWTIKAKVKHATGAGSRPTAVPPDLWAALTATYVATAELRHSLVHRTAHTNAANELVGTDASGQQLRPLSEDEQEALGRAALRAAQLVTSPQPDERVVADLTRQLGVLSELHGKSLPNVALADSLPEITVIVDRLPGVSKGYELDLPALRLRQPFQSATHADLVVRFRDRPGQDLRGRLEDTPDERVIINPDNPPPWLS